MEHDVHFRRVHFPIRQTRGVNAYYEHENNTGKTPNHQLNQLGLILNLWFWDAKQSLLMNCHK